LFIKAFETLDHILERITYYAIYVAGMITFLMAISTTYGVVMRYVFNKPEHFTYEIGILCLISSVALSLPYIQRQARNLRCDFVSNRFSPKVQGALLNVLVPILALFYLVPLVWNSWADASYSLSIGDRTYSAWGPPVGPMKLFVPIGVGFVCLVLIAELIHGLITLKKNSCEETAARH